MVTLIDQNSSSQATTAPLTVEERVRLGQLVRTIERGLSTFLEVSKALAEVRSSRLYREHNPDFQSWCRETLGLARSSVDGLIRSGEVAQMLLDSGVTLPPNMSEATIRPLASLPVALQPETWKLIEAASSKAGPSSTVSQKVVRQIKNAIESPGAATGHKTRGRKHSSRELAFIAPVRRLASYSGFDADLAISHVDKFSSALSAFTAFRIMADRRLMCCDRLSKRFPELTDA